MNKSYLGIISLIIGSILIATTFFLDLQDMIGLSVMTAGIYLAMVGVVLNKKIRETILGIIFAWR